MKIRIRLHCLLAVGVAVGGCSFAYVKPVSINGSRCSHSQALPTVDGLIATGQAVGMIYYATAPDSTFRGTPFSRGGAVALDGVAAGLFVASAIYGGTQVSDCREAYPHDVEPVIVRRSTRRPPPPPLWTPPPPPPPLWTPPPARTVSAPAPADAGSPTPDAGVVDTMAPAPPPPPRPAAPPVRQRADDE